MVALGLLAACVLMRRKPTALLKTPRWCPDARCLATLGSFGDLYPMLAIGQALRARGHEPIIAAPPVYAPRVAALGMSFIPCGRTFRPTC